MLRGTGEEVEEAALVVREGGGRVGEEVEVVAEGEEVFMGGAEEINPEDKGGWEEWIRWRLWMGRLLLASAVLYVYVVCLSPAEN